MLGCLNMDAVEIDEQTGNISELTNHFLPFLSRFSSFCAALVGIKGKVDQRCSFLTCYPFLKEDVIIQLNLRNVLCILSTSFNILLAHLFFVEIFQFIWNFISRTSGCDYLILEIRVIIRWLNSYTRASNFILLKLAHINYVL